MHTPKVVDQQVHHTEHENQEDSRQPSLETHNNHDASYKSNHREHYPGQAPLTMEDEADKEEDEQDSSGQLEVLASIRLGKRWQSCKELFLLRQRIRDDHQKSTDDTQISEEEVEIKQ